MLPHEEPMTDGQLRYLRHLIHPSEWHTIWPSMTKIEASDKIEQCIRKNESDLAAVHALSATRRTAPSGGCCRPITAFSNPKQPTLAELLPPPEPEPPHYPCTRDQFLELHSVFPGTDSATMLEAIQDLPEAEIDNLIAMGKKEREQEQERERKEAEERRAREAKEWVEEKKRVRLEWGLPAVAAPGEERITKKQAQWLMDRMGWALSNIYAMTKKEAWAMIRSMTQPQETEKSSTSYRGVDRAYMEADFGRGWAS